MSARRSHLRDVDTMCTAVFDAPGPVMQCQLDRGHEGVHAHDCTRWGDAHSKRTSDRTGPGASV